MYLLSLPVGQLGFTSFPYQAGLFSAVITAFVVPKIQDLKVDPADQSVYYMQQSVQILAQISQQLASIDAQVSTNLTHPPPYPTFHSLSSDFIVTVFWLMSLVFSLCAALAATLVQQWARAHLRPFRRQDSLLKTLWIQIILSEDVGRLQVIAQIVPRLIHLSLVLFFLGLIYAIMIIDPFVALVTIAPISICGFYYIYSVIASIMKPRWPYQNRLSNEISRLIRSLRLALYNGISRRRAVWRGKIETGRGQLATEPAAESRALDVRALRWLLDKINRSNEVDIFVLAIPGTFDRGWSQEVWKAVVGEARSMLPAGLQVDLSPGVSRLREGNTVFNFCARMRQLLETYNNETDSLDEAARKRMQGCVETVACFVCCADAPLDWFGKVGETLSELADNERINERSTIRSNPSFAVRWTCLSLVAIRKMLMAEGNRVRELAGFAVNGIVRLRSDPDISDAAAFNSAQTIDEYFKTAWEQVEDLHRAFEPWDQNRTGEEIRNILEGCELQVSELERIGNEANGMDDVDWRISLLQDAMDGATDKLTRRLPGMSFNELKSSGPIPISEAFDFPVLGRTPITPQFIFPGQQLQPLFALGRGLRNIVDGRNSEQSKEILENLESISTIPIPLRRLDHLMKRQLWRLQDLRDGGGLGFTIELFFLALRPLSLASLTLESKRILYLGTFKVITSGWMNYKHSVGTQGILLDLVCDLVIQGRGIFSDFLYPAYIVDELLDLVEKMADGHGGSHAHINDAVQELQNADPGECVDEDLRDNALRAITSPPTPALTCW